MFILELFLYPCIHSLLPDRGLWSFLRLKLGDMLHSLIRVLKITWWKKNPTQCKIYPVIFKSTLCRIVGQKHSDVQHTLQFLLKITFSFIYFVFVESVSVHAPTLLWSPRTACSCHGFPSTMLVLWALIQVIRLGGSHLSLLSHLLCTEPFNIALLKPNSPWLAACPFLSLCQPLLTVISFLF